MHFVYKICTPVAYSPPQAVLFVSPGENDYWELKEHPHNQTTILKRRIGLSDFKASLDPLHFIVSDLVIPMV